MSDANKVNDVTTDDTSSSFNFDFLFFDSNGNNTTQNSDNTLNVNTAEVANQNQTDNDNFEFFFDAFENDHECVDNNNNIDSSSDKKNSVNTNKNNQVIQTGALSNTFTTSSSQSDTNDDSKFDDIFDFMNNFTSTEEEIKDEIEVKEKATETGNKNVESTQTTVQSKNGLSEEEEELQQELIEEGQEKVNKCTVQSMYYNNNNKTTNKEYINIVKDELEDEEEMPPPSAFTLSRSRTAHANNHHHNDDNSSTSSFASTSSLPDATNNKQDKSLAQRTTSSTSKIDKNINDKLHILTTLENSSSDVKKCAADKHVDAVPEQSQSNKTSICKLHSNEKKETKAKEQERNNRHSSTLPLTSTLEFNVSDLLCRAQALVQSANVRLLADTSGENAKKVSIVTTNTKECQANEKKATVINASSDLHFNNTVHTLIKQTTHTRHDVIVQIEELQMKAIDTLKLFGPHPTLANIVLEHLSILHDAPCPLLALLMEFLQSDAPDKDKEEERRQFAAVTPVVQLLPIISCLLHKLITVEENIVNKSIEIIKICKQLNF